MKRETLGLLLGGLGVAIFAAGVPFTRIAVAELPPAFVTMGRAAIAGLIAAPVLMAGRKPIPRADLPALAFAALCIVFGFAGFMSFAMRSLPAAHGGVVLGTRPLATLAIAAAADRARPAPGFWLCAIAGAAVVVAYALRDGGAELRGADALLALAILCSSLGYVVSGKLSRRLGGTDVISWIVVLSLPVTIPLSWATAPADPAAVSAKAWAALAYLGAMSTYLAFCAWNAGLVMGGIGRTSQVQLLQIFFTLAIAALVNGERIDAPTLLAAILVVALIALGRRFRSGDAPASEAAPAR
ncbi:MAG: DMT family transporter [Hyphomicrobiales bacterium]|nr:DMT family transporter [Hyphomicrobiales bacterium]